MEFELFIKAIFPPVIMISGFLGNILLFLVLTRKKFENFPIRTMFRIQAVADSVYLLQFIEDYLAHLYRIDIRNFSSFSCKLFRYLNYSFCPISGWLLVYISLERLVSIRHPFKNSNLRKSKFQILASIFIVIWNLMYYIPVFIYHDKIQFTCDFIDPIARDLIGLLDLVNSTLLPFFFMFICSILLIYSILKSRLKVHNKGFKYDKIKRDVRFSINTVALNLIFILFNLPVCVIYVFSGYNTDLIALSALYMLYTNFAINFYVFFIVNSFFRNECLIMFKLRKKPSSNNLICIKRNNNSIKY